MRACYTQQVKAASVTPDELTAIGLNPDGEWLVREATLAHTRVDRDYEHFSPEILRDFARTLPGKPLLVGHTREGLPEGTWVSAQVVDNGLDTMLLAKFAIPVLSDNEALRQRVESGVARSVSIGFTGAKLVCDVCGLDPWSCGHWPGRVLPDGTRATATWQPPGEALEGSLVWLGSQPGAIVKAAPVGDESYACGLPVWIESETGERALSWEHLALAAIDVAGRFHGAKQLSDEQRVHAWCDILAGYAALGKEAPKWQVGESFSWDDWGLDEQRVYWDRETETYAERVQSIAEGRLRGAVKRSLELNDGNLPSRAKRALQKASACVQGLIPEDETPDAEEEIETASEAPPEEVAPTPEEPETPQQVEAKPEIDPQQALLAALAAYVPPSELERIELVSNLVEVATTGGQ